MGRFDKLETQEAREQPEMALMPEKEVAEIVTFDSLFRQGEIHFYEGDYRKAHQLYARATQEDSTRREPWIGQALSLLMQGEKRDALIWAKRAAELFPEDSDILAVQGLAFGLQGMTKRALDTLEYAAGRGAAGPLLWFCRGWALLEQDNANWKACFQRAETECGGDWKTAQRMGLVLMQYRKWALARSYLEKAAAQRSDNAFLWHQLGLALRRLGFPGKALEAQQRCLELQENHNAAQREIQKLKGLPVGSWLNRLAGLLELLPGQKGKKG